MVLVNRMARARRAKREPTPEIETRCGLFPQVEFRDHALVAIVFRSAEVIEKAPARGDHFEEAAARGVILGVTLEVFRELRDPAGQERHLDVRAAGIFIVELELLHVFRVTAFCHKRAASVDELPAFASAEGSVEFRADFRPLPRSSLSRPLTKIAKLPTIADAKNLRRPVGTRFHHSFLDRLRDARDHDHHYDDDHDSKDAGAMAVRAAPDRIELLVFQHSSPA